MFQNKTNTSLYHLGTVENEGYNGNNKNRKAIKHMIRLLIIADDFTGALDIGVQFAACDVCNWEGIDPETMLRSFMNSCAVLVVDAETRHLSPAQAGEVVGKIVAQAEELAIPYIYKKTDSALRGNIGAELSAMMAAGKGRQLPFFPAFPQMGRITFAGVHYIGQTPVAESVFGRDPFEPVKQSLVSDIIAEQSALPVHSCPAVKADEAVPDDSGILVFDASSVEDFMRTGRALRRQNKLHLMAGCAGFGAVLPELLELNGERSRLPTLDPKLLVVCGSVNPATQGQLAYAREHGFAGVHLTPEQKMSDGYWHTAEGREDMARLHRLLAEHAYCIIDANDAPGDRLTADFAADRGIDLEGIRQGIACSIGNVVKALFTDPNLGTLLITGGDTLLACMQSMGVRKLEPIGEMDIGVVVSRFTYRGVTRHVITKSGGFGDPDLLLSLAMKISQQSADDIKTTEGNQHDL